MKQYILDRCTDPNDPTLDEVPNEKIPVYEDDDAAEADLANLEVGQIVATKQVYDYTVFDINYPIGVTYTQYPQQKSPNELWGNISTWVELDYDGAFFRSSGGNANGFATSTDTLSSCKQASAIQCHNHTIILSSASGGNGGRPFAGCNTSLSSNGITECTGSSETRPVNYTVKVWVRTA